MLTYYLKLFVFLAVLGSCQHFLQKMPMNKSSDYPPQKKLFYKNIYEGVSLDSNKSVDMWLNYFTGSGRKYMKIYLERSSRYIPVMKNVLRENNLPEELVYVSLIESGFSPKALSHANAVGYWQFIYGTGKRYGLRIDGFVDERKDPILSTQAAAKYFKDLYSLFGSWHLALAAYNSGEYRVNRAVLRHYNRDFWHLSSKKALPRETRNYVPKLIAAIRIAQNPDSYGFYNLDFEPAIKYEKIQIKKPVSLFKLANNLGVSKEEMKRLNPMYKGEYVPVYSANSFIRVPIGMQNQALAQLEKSFMPKPKYKYHYHYWYRVRKGDSLYKIARRHKTTVRKLRRANNMRARASFLRIGQKLKIPSRKLVASKNPSSNRNLASLNKEFHTVQKGQSLSLIAKLYGIKLNALKDLNDIQGAPIIHPGQKLRLKKPQSKVNLNTYHVVRKGETLIEIAKKYNTPLPHLMKENSLHLKSILLTGKRLIIPR